MGENEKQFSAGSIDQDLVLKNKNLKEGHMNGKMERL